MTTLTDFQVTDNVTDNTAANHNRLLGGIIRAEFANTETITATKELADSDTQYQFITASGAARTVELAPEATTNHITLIYNAGGTYDVVVKDDSGVTTFATLTPGTWGVYLPFNAQGWKTLPAGDVTTTGTQTLTNKRVTPRITTITSSATPTINTDNCDLVTITALAAAITSMTTNLSGTPTNGQKLIIRIKDDGTARAITWGASFEAAGVALPTTTVLSKRLTVGFIYDSVSAKWSCIASAQEA